MKKMYLSSTDKKFLGVCGGIATYYGVDPTVVRAIFIVLLIGTGFVPFGLAYIVLYFILPNDPGNRSMLSRKPHA